MLEVYALRANEYDLKAADRAGLIVLAGGNHGLKRNRAMEVLSLLVGQKRALHCLRLTSEGQPAHPLYLPGTLSPMPYKVDGHD